VIASLAGQGINVQRACIMLDISQSGYYARSAGAAPSIQDILLAWRGKVLGEYPYFLGLSRADPGTRTPDPFIPVPRSSVTLAFLS
jgi:hypothetical protein